MKAISIRQPWAWAILNAGKRVENRDWRGCSYRGPVLLHAAKTMVLRDFDEAVEDILDAAKLDDDAISSLAFTRNIETIRWRPAPGLHLGGIVGRARIVDVYDQRNAAGHRMKLGVCVGCGYREPSTEELLAGADAGLFDCPHADPWASRGCIGLVLADVEPMPFIPYPGALGFFDVPDRLVGLAP